MLLHKRFSAARLAKAVSRQSGFPMPQICQSGSPLPTCQPAHEPDLPKRFPAANLPTANLPTSQIWQSGSPLSACQPKRARSAKGFPPASRCDSHLPNNKTSGSPLSDHMSPPQPIETTGIWPAPANINVSAEQLPVLGNSHSGLNIVKILPDTRPRKYGISSISS